VATMLPTPSAGPAAVRSLSRSGVGADLPHWAGGPQLREGQEAHVLHNRGGPVLGFGPAELLIIGVVLIVLIGMVVGVVLLTVFLVRRRNVVPARPEPEARPMQGRD
jgi:hypothetical protein